MIMLLAAMDSADWTFVGAVFTAVCGLLAWVGKYVIIPIKDRVITLFDSFDERDTEHIKTIEKLRELALDELVKRGQRDNQVIDSMRAISQAFEGFTTTFRQESKTASYRQGILRFVVTREGIIKDLDGDVEDVLGFSRVDLVNQNIKVLIPVKLQEIHEKKFQARADDPSLKAIAFELQSIEVRHKRGGTVRCRIHVRECDDDGAGKVFVAELKRE